MKKNLILVLSLVVLLALVMVGSYFYFLNFSKHLPGSHTHSPRDFSR